MIFSLMHNFVGKGLTKEYGGIYNYNNRVYFSLNKGFFDDLWIKLIAIKLSTYLNIVVD